jgi:hypothetical protein
MLSHILAGVNIPEIDQNRASHALLHLREIQRTELLT